VGASEPAPVAVEEALEQPLGEVMALRRRLPVALGLQLALLRDRQQARSEPLPVTLHAAA
jgi:hypothetical protein